MKVLLDGVEQVTQVADDNSFFEAHHQALVANTDTTITCGAGTARLVRVKNWDTANVILVKTTTISGSSDSAASRVGVAPVANVPAEEYYPFKATAVHLFSIGGSTVTVEFFG